MQVADGITQERADGIRQAVREAGQTVRDAAEEIIFLARVGLPIPAELQDIINKWQAGEIASDKYGR